MVKLLSKIFPKGASSKKLDDSRPSSAESLSTGIGYAGERDSNGLRSGWGRFVFQSGDTYEGEWFDNMKHGYGDAFYCSGSRYRGDWAHDCKHGKGIFVFGHDGSSYTGDWVDDVKTGYGVAVFRTGNRYAGQWVSDNMHGKGRFVYGSGDAYEGDWVRNRKSGFGTWTSADSSCTYAGEWRDDLRHGAGVLVDATGNVYEVVYRNGDLTSKNLPRRPIPAPQPVDRSVPEPPFIASHKRATSAAIRVPRAARRGGSTIPGATSPAMESSCDDPRIPPSPPTYAPAYGTPGMNLGGEYDDAPRVTPTNTSSASSTVDAAESKAEAALLSRLRAWRSGAPPPPPAPTTHAAAVAPKELTTLTYGRARESTWGTRPSPGGSSCAEEVSAEVVGKHADMSLAECDDRFDDLASHSSGARAARSGSVLSEVSYEADLPV